MKIVWSEKHEETWSEQKIKDAFQFANQQNLDVEEVIDDWLCEDMYYTDRLNVFHYVENYDEIIDNIVKHGREQGYDKDT